MDKAVFVDRDGVIIKEAEYAYRIDELEFLPGSVEALKRLTGSVYRVVIVTNQSGIARGYFTEDDYAAFTEELLSRLGKEGVRIDGVYHCPHHPTEGRGEYRTECECRKPAPGMLRRAAAELGLDLGGSWMIGDKSTDIGAGKAAGCSTVLVGTGYGGTDSPEGPSPDHTAPDLLSAVGIVLGKAARGSG